LDYINIILEFSEDFFQLLRHRQPCMSGVFEIDTPSLLK